MFYFNQSDMILIIFYIYSNNLSGVRRKIDIMHSSSFIFLLHILAETTFISTETSACPSFGCRPATPPTAPLRLHPLTSDGPCFIFTCCEQTLIFPGLKESCFVESVSTFAYVIWGLRTRDVKSIVSVKTENRFNVWIVVRVAAIYFMTFFWRIIC